MADYGFDAAIDYREGDLAGRLAAAAPDGVDVCFDNVGGEHLQAAIGANPNLAQILMYIDGNGSFSSQLVDSFNKIAQDNQATVLSVSYGLDENQQGQAAVTAENKALTQLQAEGITVFVSSGLLPGRTLSGAALVAMIAPSGRTQPRAEVPTTWSPLLSSGPSSLPRFFSLATTIPIELTSIIMQSRSVLSVPCFGPTSAVAGMQS